MYHENLLLQAEVNQLRLRIKATSDSVDTLRLRNTQLLAERDLQGLSNAVGADSSENAISSLIERYLTEIEDLRTKLIESEKVAELLRSQLSRLKTPNNAILFSPARGSNSNGAVDLESSPFLHTKSSPCLEGYNERNGLVSEAKAAVERLKHKEELLRKESENIMNGSASHGESNEIDGEDETEESDADMEDSQLERQRELAEMQMNINIQEKLIEELEAREHRLQSMKQQYEQKMSQLISRIADTESERDRVLLDLRKW